MALICIECGFSPVEPEPPRPKKKKAPPPSRCPNCGKEGSLRDAGDENGEEEEE